MVKAAVLVFAALIGSALCEPPLGFGLGLNLGLGGHGGYAAAPVAVGGYGGHGHGHGHGLALVNHAHHQPLISLVHADPAPVVYSPPKVLNLGFSSDFALGGGHGGHAPAPVVVKQPVHHHLHHSLLSPLRSLFAAKPVVAKAPVYGAPHHHHHHHHQPHSHISITPSVSYGYSYKLVPTHSHGHAHAHGHGHGHGHGHHHHHVAKAPIVKAPVKGHGGSNFGFNFGFDIGHGGRHH